MEKVLTAKDICSIVNACASSGVRELQYLDLNIKFGELIPDSQTSIHYQINDVETNNETSTLPSDQTINDELEDLFHTNPAEYERRRIEDDNQ